MNNVLYIGPYREFSTYGNASRKYIQSLDIVTNELSIKPYYNIFKSYPELRINKSILNLENIHKTIQYDTVIQHVYPHQLCYNSYFKKNIAIVHPECLGYGLDYKNYVNQMDILIVPSEFSKRSLLSIGVDQDKIFTIPIPLDFTEIDSFKNAAARPEDQHKYTFYVIDDFSIRSNIENIILAYLILLSKYINIQLVIKLQQTNISELAIKEIINNIYNIFPVDNNSIPTIIFGDTEYSQVLDLHNRGDCLIDISTGKSFGLSVLEAMAFNNNIIVLNDTAQSELIENGAGFTVNNEYTNCLDDNKMFFMYNSIRQTWPKPIFNDLINTMEMAILESDTNKKNRINAQDEIIKLYSIKKISELFSSII